MAFKGSGLRTCIGRNIALVSSASLIYTVYCD